jgi:hypothetical protein
MISALQKIDFVMTKKALEFHFHFIIMASSGCVLICPIGWHTVHIYFSSNNRRLLSEEWKLEKRARQSKYAKFGLHSFDPHLDL